MVRRIPTAERRARLGLRHRLAAPAAAIETAADSVVALHATDPATVFLSLQARTEPGRFDVAAIERALYDDRTLLRLLAMRRTMFVVPVGAAPVLQGSSAVALATTQRRRYSTLLTEAGVGDAGWLKELEEEALLALVARGEATGAQLSADVPRLRTPIVMAAGKPYESRQNVTTWVLFMLAVDGRIARGRPLGSWTSTQWRWSEMDAWLGGPLPELSPAEARVELVRRWLAAFGPGTVADLRWWTGWTAAHVKQALAVLKPVEVELDGGPGLVLPGDAEPVTAPQPWIALLPALDPTPMGWQQRDWYLGEHGPTLFDRSGNIGPSVWCDGRIVGGWAQRADGEIRYRMFEDLGSERVAEVAAAADRLAGWIGPTRVTPRFRTPLERELSA